MFTFPDWPIKAMVVLGSVVAHAVFLVRAVRPLARSCAPIRPDAPMEPFAVGLISLVAIVLLIYGGCYVAITLSLVSFLGVWFIKDDPTIAMRMMTLSVTEAIRHYDYASIPTFVMMGLIVGKAVSAPTSTRSPTSYSGACAAASASPPSPPMRPLPPLPAPRSRRPRCSPACRCRK